jgi:hypothetical protein
LTSSRYRLDLDWGRARSGACGGRDGDGLGARSLSQPAERQRQCPSPCPAAADTTASPSTTTPAYPTPRAGRTVPASTLVHGAHQRLDLPQQQCPDPSPARGRQHLAVAAQETWRGLRHSALREYPRQLVRLVDEHEMPRRLRPVQRHLEKKRSAVTAVLRVGGLTPVSVSCTWKARSSSAVAVSGERFGKAASLLTARTYSRCVSGVNRRTSCLRACIGAAG